MNATWRWRKVEYEGEGDFESVEVPWFVKRRLGPSEVRQLLERRMQQEGRKPWFTLEEWTDFLLRKKLGLLKRPEGKSRRRCLYCGARLDEFAITDDKSVLRKAKRNPEVRRLITGYMCPRCLISFFEAKEGITFK
jgi:hypothetical protein